HAREAAEDLERLAGMQSTKIDLWSILDGKGFPRNLIEDCLARWGSRAPERIRRDPFILLTSGLVGAGFVRCDALYLELGGRPDRLKRQTLALWHAIRTRGSGDTWFRKEHATQILRQALKARVQPRPDQAIRLGVLARWLA